MENICNLLGDLVEYAVEKNLAEERDRTFLQNRLLEEFHGLSFDADRKPRKNLDLEGLLKEILDYAVANGVIPDNGVTGRDLFDTKLMGLLLPRPGEVAKKFWELYEQSPEAATDYYYRLSCDSDYIRTYRVKKDARWIYSGKYGDLDITINLSKPEKDPKAIAAAKLAKPSGYPKCAICPENEGFSGSMTQAARQSHRLIPMTIAGEDWYLQYSPYVYYNEHCIALSARHTPMKVDRATFVKQMDFISLFPHYFLGSNADLPIVGGSILTHDHMQGGHYTFAMERAGIETELHFKGFDNVRAGIVKWPMSVIRLTSADREALIELADRILQAWRGYTDEAAGIFANTNGEPHNTITPIARRRGKDYELDLVLRNNLTTEEYPLGVFHPHAEKHNIKKENIGLIEVMGLAVLPARLKKEMALVAECMLGKRDFDADEATAKHKTWVEGFIGNYRVTEANVNEILQKEIGKTFEGVLEDAGVYKPTKEGREAFLRFVKSI